MNKVALQNFAMIVAPLLSISVAGGGTIYQFRRLQRYQDDLAAKRKQVSILEGSLREMQIKKILPRIPIALQSPREQPEFLNAVRSYAEPLRVQLSRWTNAINKPALAQNNTANGENKEAPKEYQAIANTLEVKGKYTAVRAFLYQLLRAPRLYTLNDVKWSREAKGGLTTTSFTLTRYVTAPSSSIAQVMQAHAKAANGANGAQNSDSNALTEKRGLFSSPSSAMKRELDETTQPKADHYHDQQNR